MLRHPMKSNIDIGFVVKVKTCTHGTRHCRSIFCHNVDKFQWQRSKDGIYKIDKGSGTEARIPPELITGYVCFPYFYRFIQLCLLFSLFMPSTFVYIIFMKEKDNIPHTYIYYYVPTYIHYII